MMHIKNITWFEVFQTNADGIVETIYSHSDLEKCIKVYRKHKLLNRSTKIDKWQDRHYLPSPMSIKCILE